MEVYVHARRVLDPGSRSEDLDPVLEPVWGLAGSAGKDGLNPGVSGKEQPHAHRFHQPERVERHAREQHCRAPGIVEVGPHAPGGATQRGIPPVAVDARPELRRNAPAHRIHRRQVVAEAAGQHFHFQSCGVIHHVHRLRRERPLEAAVRARIQTADAVTAPPHAPIGVAGLEAQAGDPQPPGPYQNRHRIPQVVGIAGDQGDVQRVEQPCPLEAPVGTEVELRRATPVSRGGIAEVERLVRRARVENESPQVQLAGVDEVPVVARRTVPGEHRAVPVPDHLPHRIHALVLGRQGRDRRAADEQHREVGVRKDERLLERLDRVHRGTIAAILPRPEPVNAAAEVTRVPEQRSRQRRRQVHTGMAVRRLQGAGVRRVEDVAVLERPRVEAALAERQQRHAEDVLDFRLGGVDVRDFREIPGIRRRVPESPQLRREGRGIGALVDREPDVVVGGLVHAAAGLARDGVQQRRVTFDAAPLVELDRVEGRGYQVRLGIDQEDVRQHRDRGVQLHPVRKRLAAVDHRVPEHRHRRARGELRQRSLPVIQL